MHYVIAHDDYYPRGGFKDIMFKGSFEDCELVKEAIVRKSRYDRVYITEDNTRTDVSSWVN